MLHSKLLYYKFRSARQIIIHVYVRQLGMDKLGEIWHKCEPSYMCVAIIRAPILICIGGGGGLLRVDAKIGTTLYVLFVAFVDALDPEINATILDTYLFIRSKDRG